MVPGPASKQCGAGMIRNLRDDDAQAYFDFRRQALLEQPFAFQSSPEVEPGGK